MDISKDVIEKILSLGQPNVVERDHVLYTDKALKMVERPDYDCLSVNSLESVVDLYSILEGKVGFAHPLMVMVESYDVVSIRTKGYRDFDSCVFVKAYPIHETDFAYGRFMKQDDFSIQILTKFLHELDLEDLYQISSRLTSESIKVSEDNRISQSVVIQTGVSTKTGVDVKPVWRLRPYRTFLEVTQPESPFLFRLRGVKDQLPECALFEVDGGKWKIEAKKEIVNWLRGKLTNKVTIVS